MRGIGERLTELSPMPQGYVLIGKPGVSVSTKFVYGNLNAAGLASHPDIDRMIAALEARDFTVLPAVWKMCWRT